MKNSLIITTALASASAAFAQTVVNPANFPGDVTQSGSIINIVDDITLSSGEYILDTTTIVNPGATLTINPGVIVRGQPSDGGNPGSLLVSRGAAIDAVGTVTNPIIFTTAADTNRERWEPGDAFLDAAPATDPLPPVDPANVAISNTGLWGAVTLLGYAPTNRGAADTGVSGEAYVEGFGLSTEQVTYGGSLPNDSSGSLKYVSIRHTGKTITEGDEQQGLTLGGVGAGTLLEYIDIYCSQDDGIEIFGGTASLSKVMISYVNDDGFDLDQGWTGNAQFLFILAANNSTWSGNVRSDEMGEWDGEDGVTNEAFDNSGVITSTGQPFTAPTIYNMTMFCDGASGSIEADSSFGGNVFNSILFELGEDTFDIEDESTGNPVATGFPSSSPSDRLLAGSFNINGVSFIGKAGTNATDTTGGISETSFAEGVVTNDNAIALNSTTNTFTTGNPLLFGVAAQAVNGTGNIWYNEQETANGVNPVPLANATSGLVPVAGAFFEEASYRGAFPQNPLTVLFTTGWTALNIDGILVDAGNGANVL